MRNASIIGSRDQHIDFPRAFSAAVQVNSGSAGPQNELVVDLDGTLIKTDLLHETANQFVTRRPFQGFRLALWLTSGKCVLKTRLAEASGIDAESLPYNEPVVDWLRGQKRQGRRLVLATASHRRLAEAVARHLGFFDEVLATDGETNLKSRRKRDLLVQRYGERGFDYVGNDAADLPVWQSAERAYLVSSSPRLISTVRSQGNLVQIFDDGRAPRLKSVVGALRPHQWLKNLLILVPLFAAHRYGDQKSLIDGLLAFVLFSITASSVYLFNDLVDVADDRHHPRKRRRPFAAGDLALPQGWLAWPALLVAALALAAALLPPAFLASLGAYFVLTLAYSLRLKQIAVVDVLTLAGLYTLRIVAGAAAVSVPLSFWLLTFSIFIFLSLALMKRFSELKSTRNTGGQKGIRGRGYVHDDLEIVSSLGTGAGYIAVLVLALYIQDSHTTELYPTPKFIWMACPLLLFWISRAWLIAHRGQMHDDPVVFALKDRVSWMVGVWLIAVFGLARAVA
jgi:4-hydroxybenzoate polyprenyltransferase/phosphoserine phosphatase